MFNKDSQMVKSMLLLIREGIKTREDIPDLFNLREVVLKCLDS